MPKKSTKSSAKPTAGSKSLASFRIENPEGLHARAAAAFVKVASQFDSEITVKKENMTVNGRSILGVLMLGAEEGHTIELEATGREAVETLHALGQLIANHFET